MWEKFSNWKNIFLYFLAVLHSTVPQAIPISTCDRILSDTNAAMQKTELKLSNLQSSSVPNVQSLSGTTASTAPSLSTATSTYGKSLMDFSSILNFGRYQNVSACEDINMKISSIDFDLQKLVVLNSQALQNFTTLQTKINYIVYYFGISYNILTAAQVSTYVAIINEYYAIASGYSEYVYMLNVAYGNETYVQAILQAFKRQYCVCASTVTGNVSTLESNLAYIQSPLLADQSRLKAAIGSASGVLSAAINGIPVTTTTSCVLNYIQSLLTFLGKAGTVNDYAASTTTTSTSCTDIQKRVTIIKVMFLSCSNVYSQILANASVLDVYIGPVNVSLIAYNSSLSQSQRNLLQAACNSLGYLRSLYTDYYVDILYASARFGKVLADVSGIGDTYCGCKSISGNSVVTAAKTSTSISPTSSTTTSTVPITSRTTTTFSTTSSTTSETTTSPSTTSTTVSTTSTTLPTSTTTEPSTTSTSSTTSSATTPEPLTTSTSSTISTTSETTTTPSTTSTTIPTTSTTEPITSTSSTTIPPTFTTSTTEATYSTTSTLTTTEPITTFTVPSTSTTASTESTTTQPTSTSTSTTEPSTTSTTSTFSTTAFTTSSIPITTIAELTSTTTLPTSTSTTSTTSTTIPSTTTTEPTSASTSSTIPLTSTTTSTTSTQPITTSTSTTTESTTESTTTTILLTSTTTTESTTTTTIPPTFTTSTTLPSTTTTSTTLPLTTSTTLPPTTITTTKAPNLAACAYTGPLTNSSGSYIKSICYVSSSLNFTSAADTCAGANMNFFIIDSVETYTAYKANINTNLATGRQQLLFNGRLNAGIVRTITTNTVTFNGFTYSGKATTGCLMTVRTVAKVFSAQAVNCASLLAPFHCEFTNSLLKDEAATSTTGRSVFGAGTTTKKSATTTLKSKAAAKSRQKRSKKVLQKLKDDQQQQPNLSRCNHTTDLKDSDNNFIKTICFIPSSDGNRADVADDICRSLNMNLFTIESAATQKAYFDYMKNYFQKGTAVKVMINGRKTQNDREIVTVTKPEVLIYSNYTVSGHHGCIGIIRNARNSVTAVSSGCAKNKGNFHCEYGAPTPWLEPKAAATTEAATEEEEATTTEEETTLAPTTRATTKKATTKPAAVKADPNAIVPAFTGSAGNQTCGTFVPYNYLKDPLGPSKKGVKVGTADMPPTYIGIGNAMTCSGMTNVPGHILVPPNNPVCMVICDKVQIDADTPKFLLNHPKLAWIDKTKIPNGAKLVESLDTSKSQIFNFGRILRKTKSGTEYKIGAINGDLFSYNIGSFKQISLSGIAYRQSGYQVLICKL